MEIRADVTEAMNEHIEERVETGRFSSKAEYIRDLIRDDMREGGEL